MSDNILIMSYEELLEKIRSIQSVLDEQHRLQTRRILPSLLLDMWLVDYYLNYLEAIDRWSQNEVENGHRAVQARNRLINQITIISNNFNLNSSLVQHLPALETPNWYSLYPFLRLMTDSSQVVPQTSNSPQEECPICIEPFQMGDRFIEFPCWPEHRLHEACFTGYAGFTPNFSCPLCRRFPTAQ